MLMSIAGTTSARSSAAAAGAVTRMRTAPSELDDATVARHLDLHLVCPDAHDLHVVEGVALVHQAVVEHRHRLPVLRADGLELEVHRAGPAGRRSGAGRLRWGRLRWCRLG